MAYTFFWNCSTSLGWGHSNFALLSIFLVLIIGSCAGVSEFVFQFTLPAIEHTVIRLSEPCSDSVIPLSKVWHQRLSVCSLAQPPFPAYHPLLVSMTFQAVWTAHHSLIACCFSTSPGLDSCAALWQEYTFFLSSHPFKTIPFLRYPVQEPYAWLQ